MDFVVTWVDDSDPLWREEYYKYKKLTSDDVREVRFRSWDNFHLWFRGVEMFAPWVRMVHFVTWGHIPKWLNTSHPKLNVVKHSDFIPEEYLPTFNTRTIELNFHRIKGISEEYVVFNDDVFIINNVSEDMFFVDGKPCDMPVIKPLDLSEYSKAILNDMIVINRHFDLKSQFKSSKKKWLSLKYGKNSFMNIVFGYMFRSHHFTFKNYHISLPSKKSTLSTLWDKEYEAMHKSCNNTFRNPDSVNNYVQRYWDIASNSFHPYNVQFNGSHFDVSESNLDEVVSFIKGQSKGIVCVNDSASINDFDYIRDNVNYALNEILHNKSKFEL